MKIRAASFTASIRLGLMSVALMLPDTSMERITVPSSEGSFTVAEGRASAKIDHGKTGNEKSRGDVPAEPRAPCRGHP